MSPTITSAATTLILKLVKTTKSLRHIALMTVRFDTRVTQLILLMSEANPLLAIHVSGSSGYNYTYNLDAIIYYKITSIVNVIRLKLFTLFKHCEQAR